MGKGGLQKCSNVLKNVVLAKRESGLSKGKVFSAAYGVATLRARRQRRVDSESFAGNDIDHPAGQVRAKGGFSAPSWEKGPLHDRK